MQKRFRPTESEEFFSRYKPAVAAIVALRRREDFPKPLDEWLRYAMVWRG